MFVKSADRVIQIFEILAPERKGITHGELSRALHIPKSSLSPLLLTLTHREYLTFDTSTKRYSLGSKLLILTGHYLSNLDIVRVGRPIIQRLVSEINEDTELAVMKGTEILFLHKEECSKPLKYSIEIGQRAPAYATACGKAIIAHYSEEEIADFFSSITLKKFTANTETDRERLIEELQHVRTTGLAYGRQEFQEGISATAAPVFNHCGNVIGSITVTVPSIRFNTKHNRFIGPRLLRAASDISRKLGFDPDDFKEAQEDRKDKPTPFSKAKGNAH